MTFLIFRYEFFFGGMSSSNLCVTQAMQRDLWEHWGIRLELNAFNYMYLEISAIFSAIFSDRARSTTDLCKEHCCVI